MMPNIPEHAAHTSVLCRLWKLHDDIAILIQMHPMLWLNDDGGQVLVKNCRADKLKAGR
jgi:hypothetical protein